MSSTIDSTTKRRLAKTVSCNWWHVSGARTILEIGVWRGERTRRFIEISLARHLPEGVQYFGVDLFESMPVELVTLEASRRSTNPTRQEVSHSLSALAARFVGIHLVAGNIFETLLNIQLPRIVFAFIDGSNFYEGVRNDWESVRTCMDPDNMGVFDE